MRAETRHPVRQLVQSEPCGSTWNDTAEGRCWSWLFAPVTRAKAVGGACKGSRCVQRLGIRCGNCCKRSSADRCGTTCVQRLGSRCGSFVPIELCESMRNDRLDSIGQGTCTYRQDARVARFLCSAASVERFSQLETAFGHRCAFSADRSEVSRKEMLFRLYSFLRR